MSHETPYEIVLAVDDVNKSHHAIAQAFHLARRIGLHHHQHRRPSVDATSPTHAVSNPFILHMISIETSEGAKPPSSYGSRTVRASAAPTAPVETLEQRIHAYIAKFNYRCDYDLTVVKMDKGQNVGHTLATAIMEHWPTLNLCVVGTRNQKGLKKLMLGSVSEHLIQELPCPVMVCKNPE